MYDGPNIIQLLQAARQHLEANVIPATRDINHRLYFQTLVAANVLAIVEREMMFGSQHQAARWQRLNALFGETPDRPTSHEGWDEMMRDQAERLYREIQAGQHDTNPALFEHLLQSTREQLEVANPKYLHTVEAEAAPAR